MQTGVLDEVPAGGGGDGGDVADVLHHGGDGDGCHDQDRGHVELGDDELLQTHEVGAGHLGEVHLTGDQRHDVRAYHAQQDGDDLDHALAPDVGGDDDEDGRDGDPPVAGAVIDGGGGQVQADGDDDGAGDDGREEAHDLLGAERLEQSREDDIHKTRARDAEAGIGQHLEVGLVLLLAEHRSDGGVAAEEGEGRTEEGRDLAAGDEVEQERAEAREQKRVRNVEARQDGHEDRRAEHGEHVLEAEQQHSARAKLSGIIDAGFRNFVFSHGVLLSLRRFCGAVRVAAAHKKRIVKTGNTSFTIPSAKTNTTPEQRVPRQKQKRKRIV